MMQAFARLPPGHMVRESGGQDRTRPARAGGQDTTQLSWSDITLPDLYILRHSADSYARVPMEAVMVPSSQLMPSAPSARPAHRLEAVSPGDWIRVMSVIQDSSRSPPAAGFSTVLY